MNSGTLVIIEKKKKTERKNYVTSIFFLHEKHNCPLHILYFNFTVLFVQSDSKPTFLY